MSISLKELILAVKEKNLTKDALDNYRDDLANVTSQMFMEMANLEKLEALFEPLTEQETEANRKRRWKATEKGQRMIELKNYIRASKEILSSLKSRLYLVY